MADRSSRSGRHGSRSSRSTRGPAPPPPPASPRRRVALWTLGVLALPLLLAAAWLAAQWRDAAALPWPETLQPQPPLSVEAQQGYEALASMPEPAQTLPDLGCDGAAPDAGCAAAWSGRTLLWTERRQRNAVFGQACEQHVQGGALLLAEPVSAIGAPLGLTQCSAWLLSGSWLALQSQQPAEALRLLRGAQALHRAWLAGAQSRAGHATALRLIGQELLVLQQLAQRYPDQIPALLPLATLQEPELLAAVRRWMPHEAQLRRAEWVELAAQGGATAGALCAERLAEDPVRAGLCRVSLVRWPPQAAEQAEAARWQQRLRLLQGATDLSDALAQLLRTEGEGAALHWSHTGVHLLQSAAHADDLTLLRRAADLQAAATATALWLQAQQDRVPRERQWQWLGTRWPAWLATRLELDDQSVWQLLPNLPDAALQVPTRWPAPLAPGAGAGPGVALTGG